MIQREKVSVCVSVKASIALATTWAVWWLVSAAIPLLALGKVRGSCWYELLAEEPSLVSGFHIPPAYCAEKKRFEMGASGLAMLRVI